MANVAAVKPLASFSPLGATQSVWTRRLRGTFRR